MTNKALDICSIFEKNANELTARGQKRYMKNQFEFYGIKAPLRRRLQRPFLLKSNLPAQDKLASIVRKLWNKNERECHYFAQELVLQYTGQFQRKDMALLEYMITNKSWWDTTDFIATNLVAAFFNEYPDEQKIKVNQWIKSGNIWLQRAAILFQLHYKHALDRELLTHIIHSLLGSKEFFVNKAIGWILREYSKINPAWVKNFIASTDLHSLSQREALKYISK